MKLRSIALSGAVAFLAISQCGAAETVDAKTRKLHEQLIVLDTHLDTPAHFDRAGWNIMDRHSYDKDMSQIDYPRMVEGGLDGGFWVIFTDQGPLTPAGYLAARDHAFKRVLQIREMVAKNSSHFALALQADDAQRIVAAGKRVVFISMENSYPLGEDLSMLESFYSMGLRLAGPVHFKNNEFADSATDSKHWNGLSPLGKQFVAEANRLGIVLDASHASDDVFDQLVELSKTPIILSHSGTKAIYNHPRNLDDARLKKLAASGGVIQVLAADRYLAPMPNAPEYDKAMEKFDHLQELTPQQVTEFVAQKKALQIKYHFPKVTIDDFMRSLLHAIEVAGIDHVGLGIDWDGGGGIEGLNDATDIPKITARLLRAGYSREDIAKVTGGNVLRVLKQAETYAQSQRAAATH